MGLLLGTNLEFYIILSKGIRLKVRKFWRLIPTFLEVTGEKLVGGGGGGGAFCLPPILNRVKQLFSYQKGIFHHSTVMLLLFRS